MRYFVEYLSKNLNLSKEKEDVIYYGLFVVVTNLISIFSVLFMGYILQQFCNTLILMLFYTPLRLYIGGYHSKTPISCFITFNMIFLVFILIMSVVKYNVILDVITEILLFFILIDICHNDQTKKKTTKILLVCVYLMALLISFDYHYILVLAIDINILLYVLKKLQSLFNNQEAL